MDLIDYYKELVDICRTNQIEIVFSNNPAGLNTMLVDRKDKIILEQFIPFEQGVHKIMDTLRKRNIEFPNKYKFLYDSRSI